VLLDRLGRLQRDGIAGPVALLDRQVVVLHFHVEVGQDEFVLNFVPNYSSM
jgi:hypothetical protein